MIEMRWLLRKPFEYYSDQRQRYVTSEAVNPVLQFRCQLQDGSYTPWCDVPSVQA